MGLLRVSQLLAQVSTTIKSRAATSSAVNLILDTVTSWTNVTDKYVSFRTAGVERGYVGVYNGTNGIKLGGDAASYVGIDTALTGLHFVVAGASIMYMNGSSLYPAGTSDIGQSGLPYRAGYFNWIGAIEGAQLTAAATITPTVGQHHVTGATTIDTIATTNKQGNSELFLIADGGTITWSAAGNILSAGTIAQDKGQLFRWSAASSKWVPHQ